MIVNRWLRLAGGLGESERSLFGVILRAFLATGGPPPQVDLHEAAEKLGVHCASALHELDRRDLIVYDADTGLILAAYPFSAVATAHRVIFDGGTAVFAMCAVDALGMPFMAGCDATVLSTDLLTGRALQIRLETASGRVTGAPPALVMFFGETGGSGAAMSCLCPFINFFESPASAESFAKANPGKIGRILTLPAAVERGRETFDFPRELFTSD